MILIGQPALAQENPLLDFLFIYEIMLFPWNLEINKPSPGVHQRPSIRHLLPQLVKYND